MRATEIRAVVDAMRDRAPEQLIELLQRLSLATASDVNRMAGRVRRLSRDLPRFESVWVDALAQARILTPFQANEINAGRADSLRIGPFVLCQRLPWPQYADSYRARRIDSGRIVRLVVVENAGESSQTILERFEELAERSSGLSSVHLAPVGEADRDAQRIWAAFPWTEGRSAAEWMAHNGRLPPEVALQIARTMLVGLGELESAGLCHGDVGASSVLLGTDGDAVLLQPGIRGILRPEEGYAHADLPPEAYDYLAPERISEGTPTTTASDVYACGCVWWHMLCGRVPLSGGNSVAKLRCGQAAKVPELRRYATEVPGPLASAIAACLQRDPQRRPESIARLNAMLGSPTRCGRTALVRSVVGGRRPASRWKATTRVLRRHNKSPLWPAALAVCMLVAAAVIWPIWRERVSNSAEHRAISAAESSGHADGATDRETVVREEPIGFVMDNEARRLEPSGPIDPGQPADGAVVPAHFESPRQPQPPAPLVLDSDGPLRVDSLGLKPGQHVRGRPGRRPLVVVPRAGLAVDVEGVRFENIDFLYEHAAESDSRKGAIVRLRCFRASFSGCSFRTSRASHARPDAVRWDGAAEASNGLLELPSGVVQLSDCVLRGVRSGIDCRVAGALGIEFDNTLHLGDGPLIRLNHCPGADEPVFVSLRGVTLRGGGGLLECRYRDIGPRPGKISIRSTGCALVCGRGAALLIFSGPTPPDALLNSVHWTGQGSLVSPETAIAQWRMPDGRVQALDEASVSIAGLVRSEVDFAAEAEGRPSASRIVRWQAPLRTTDPPGIDPNRLP